MSIFNLTDEKMKETSSTFTAHEIYQQPATWRKTCAQLAGCKDELQAFIDQVVKQDDFDIVLVGAGTSEFVGNSLFQALNPKYNYKVKSYASTDIVPSPENFLSVSYTHLEVYKRQELVAARKLIQIKTCKAA